MSVAKEFARVKSCAPLFTTLHHSSPGKSVKICELKIGGEGKAKSVGLSSKTEQVDLPFKICA